MSIKESALASVEAGLTTVREMATTSVKATLSKYVGVTSVVCYTPESWSALICFAVLSGVSPAKFEEALGVSGEELLAWMGGKVPEKGEVMVAGVELVTHELVL